MRNQNTATMMFATAFLVCIACVAARRHVLPKAEGFMNFPFASRHFPVGIYGLPNEEFGGYGMSQWRPRDFGRGPMHHNRLKTKIRNETKGNMKIQEMTKDGDGYHEYSRLTTFGGPLKGGKLQQINAQNFIDELNDNTTKREECNGKKPCPTGKFCHPLSMTCIDQVKEGERCFMKRQCAKEGIACIFGRCRKGKDGEPGAICSSHKECGENSCCTPGSSGVRMCTTKLESGAACTKPMSFPGIFGFGFKREKEVTCNPCKNGLKCTKTGGIMYGESYCVPTKYAEEENEQDDEEDDDELEMIDATDLPEPNQKAATQPDAQDKSAGDASTDNGSTQGDSPDQSAGSGPPNQPQEQQKPAQNTPLANLMSDKHKTKKEKSKQ